MLSATARRPSLRRGARSETSVTIPESVSYGGETYAVTEIAESAFVGWDSLSEGRPARGAHAHRRVRVRGDAAYGGLVGHRGGAVYRRVSHRGEYPEPVREHVRRCRGNGAHRRPRVRLYSERLTSVTLPEGAAVYRGGCVYFLYRTRFGDAAGQPAGDRGERVRRLHFAHAGRLPRRRSRASARGRSGTVTARSSLLQTRRGGIMSNRTAVCRASTLPTNGCSNCWCTAEASWSASHSGNAENRRAGARAPALLRSFYP